MARASRRVRTALQRRTAARLVQLMPTAIDLYDIVRSEARSGARRNAFRCEIGERQIKRAGRARIERWFGEAMDRQATSSFVMDANGNSKIPRRRLDLIEWDLHQFLRSRPKANEKPKKET